MTFFFLFYRKTITIIDISQESTHQPTLVGSHDLSPADLPTPNEQLLILQDKTIDNMQKTPQTRESTLKSEFDNIFTSLNLIEMSRLNANIVINFWFENPKIEPSTYGSIKEVVYIMSFD